MSVFFALPASLLNGADWEVKRKVPVSVIEYRLFSLYTILSNF
jgi:hypothetical protein